MADRTERGAWRRLPPPARVVILLLAIVVALNVAIAYVSHVTAGSEPSGPASSSLAASAAGYEAWADLLAKSGLPVVRLRKPLDDAPLVAGSTVVVADPSSLSTAEIDALHTFLAGGGRVVALGVRCVPLLQGVLSSGAPRWTDAPVTAAAPTGHAPETAGVSEVDTTGTGGSFDFAGRTGPILAGDGHVLATVASVGRGRLVAIADSSVFSNAELASADNAKLSLDVVGTAPTQVAFDEAAHGFGAGEGIGGLPLRWQWTLVLAAVAAGLWMWSRAKRLGPAEVAGRELPPARRGYVEAMATGLARTGPTGAAAAPVREAARELLAARASVAVDVPDEVLAEAAAAAGVPAYVTAGVLGGVGAMAGQTEGDVLAAGRALAWLEGGSRR